MKTDGRVDFLLKQINDSLMKRADNDLRTGGLTLMQVSLFTAPHRSSNSEMTMKERSTPPSPGRQSPALCRGWRGRASSKHMSTPQTGGRRSSTSQRKGRRCSPGPCSAWEVRRRDLSAGFPTMRRGRFFFTCCYSEKAFFFQLIPTCTADLSGEAEITSDDFDKMKRQNKM